MPALDQLIKGLRSQPEGTEIRLSNGLLLSFSSLAPEILELRRARGLPSDREAKTVAQHAWPLTANWELHRTADGLRLVRKQLRTPQNRVG